MSVHALPARAGDLSPATVEELRAEIDQVDGQLLSLIERRQQLVGRIGPTKADRPLKLHPAREAAVITRLQGRASGLAAPLVEPLWREVMSAGLAAQQEVKVATWPGGRDDLARLTRARFGARAHYESAASAEAALEAAIEKPVVAVLALRPESAWWSELLRLPELAIFEAIGGRGPLDPVALCVGRLPVETLARGVAYRVSHGGDSEPSGLPARVLGVDSGQRLTAVKDSGKARLDRELGWVGAAAIL